MGGALTQLVASASIHHCSTQQTQQAQGEKRLREQQKTPYFIVNHWESLGH